ncbi:alpha/beta hydrolase [Gordonia sp. ABSL11-1]|uniref:alpha/beta fold hydrolase n=1 Tax=Gordonia sp. ABSL11-1 TaxID=3053924 RepID=UPI002572AB8E|nr:alpha/beta hydrolase [Gordonia sp. ABSL11-1]MDL9948262.1 alpha/beta hydrolase [Gordonia sp. ABSL11-1]
MTPLDYRFITVNGIRTRVLQGGDPGASEAAVFLHGAPGSADAWRALLSDVAAIGRVVAFDLPGYGEADRPDDFGHTVADYATYIGSVITALGIHRVHLVMNDIGGSGLAWAVDHPDAFASSVQLDTGIINQMRAWHPVGRLFRTPGIGALAERFGRLAIQPIMAHYDVVPRATVRGWKAEFDRGQRRALHRMYKANPVDVGAPFIEPLSRLSRPALVIWGGHDKFVPVGKADQRVAFPEAKVVILPASGHYPHLDDPESVRAHVIPFLRQHLNRGNDIHTDSR